MYYSSYLQIARDHAVGFILDTPTWRANTDWGARLGYDAAALQEVNADAAGFVARLREQWEETGLVCVLNGVIGPHGDAYKDGNLEEGAAQKYHAPQVETFAATEVDMVSAVTMNKVGEAIGIGRAAKAAGLPCVISFTVETDGRLIDGTTLREAVERTEQALDGSPICYMVNCAHPLHFEGAMGRGSPWTDRIQGIRANASSKSHSELDDSASLDIGDPADLADRYRVLSLDFPALKVFGGCCGTDHRHIQAIAAAVLSS
ncbi:S-methylmethionine-dependent homocysteine/selenocysteine methylase [Rhodoligotrophos appendicifer]